MKRLPNGGRIDRSRPLGFRWNDETLSGFAGDTLASALLAAGKRVLGPSVTLGRPRGITSAGFEEAHGFAQIGAGTASEPLVRMTAVELYDGLVARDLITKGRLVEGADGARFDKRHGHCDLLVVGGGPAGLAAALVGSRAGARVILIEDDFALGGSLVRDVATLDGKPAGDWVAATVGELAAAREVRVLLSTTASVALDQNGIMAVERIGSRLPLPERGGLPEKRLWQIRARTIVLATGSLERPIVFQDNDRPGIMLATAARAYLHRFALAPERGVVFTTNDDGYRTALDWHAAGVVVGGVVDPRSDPSGALPVAARAAGIPILFGVVDSTGAHADGRLARVRVTTAAGPQTIACDILAVSGGFDPALNLHQQLRGATRWDAELLATVPGQPLPGQSIAGAAAGRFTLGECLQSGAAAAAEALGLSSPGWAIPTSNDQPGGAPIALWQVPAPDGDESRSFVDSHRDATVQGVSRAVATGIRHVEHVKRYTLIGTGVEQGRAAKANAGALTAIATGRPVADTGTSSARPPVEPIAFHVLAGRAKGPLFEPVRTTALHAAHQQMGAVFEVVGQWLRPQYYPRPGESRDDAVIRECRAVRDDVALMDVSTLGKIDVQGPDAAIFLDRLYTNTISTLGVGKARYGLMCRLDGIIFDDGVVMRLAEDRFFVTTTTGHAAAVLEWMEEWLQTEWPDLRVWTTSITEQWATVALVGPRSRSVMARLAPELDVSNQAFPFMAVRRSTVAGMPNAQVARVSFSGELAFEISVPATSGSTLWEAVRAAGEPEGIEPYGMDALHVLRAEKGYLIVGQETDSLTTPLDAGLGWMVAKKKDFIGKRSLARPDMLRPDRLQLVGFLPVDPTALVPDGAGLVADPAQPKPMTVQGHVTASHFSPALGRTFGLAMVKGGSGRHGEVLHAPVGDRSIAVTVTDFVMYDKEGAKRDG